MHQFQNPGPIQICLLIILFAFFTALHFSMTFCQCKADGTLQIKKIKQNQPSVSVSQQAHWILPTLSRSIIASRNILQTYSD